MPRTLLCFLLAAQLYAADPRLGTWKIVSAEATMDPPITMTFSAEGDSIRMSFLNGAQFLAKLDGRDYAVTGSAAYNQVSLHQTDANTIDGVWKKDGKEVGTVRYRVSETDPNQLRMTFIYDQVFTRRGQSTNATNKVLGVWVRDESQSALEEWRTQTYTAEGPNGVRRESSSGVSYVASLDGKESTTSDGLSIAVQLLDANSVLEVFRRQGKVAIEAKLTYQKE